MLNCSLINELNKTFDRLSFYIWMTVIILPLWKFVLHSFRDPTEMSNRLTREPSSVCWRRAANGPFTHSSLGSQVTMDFLSWCSVVFLTCLLILQNFHKICLSYYFPCLSNFRILLWRYLFCFLLLLFLQEVQLYTVKSPSWHLKLVPLT